MKKVKCVIISGGLMEDDHYHRKLIKGAEKVICADGGGRHAARLGVTPDFIVGDLDTLLSEEINEWKKAGVEFIKYPKAKDYTDTHLALLKALELGYKQIEMVACLGGRFDHSLANVMLLALPAVRMVDLRILDPIQEIFLVKPGMKLIGNKGETISLLPLSEEVTGIVTSGLLYEVPAGKFTMGVSNGISNVFSAEEIKIILEKGLLLGIRIRKGQE